MRNVHSDYNPGGRYNCDFCRRSFGNKYNLEAHVNSHTGDRPYVCNICDKAFQNKSNMRAHAFAAHKDVEEYRDGRKISDYPFVCDYCDEGFKSSINRRCHIVKMHSEEIEVEPEIF